MTASCSTKAPESLADGEEAARFPIFFAPKALQRVFKISKVLSLERLRRDI
jgi:hypothetical protein